MRILVTGGTGFVGRNLCRALLDREHDVTAIGLRRRPRQSISNDRYRYLAADTSRPGPWQAEAEQADAVVNLAGKTVFKRWTRACKREIHDSRVLTTRHVAQAIKPGTVLLSTSAVGYYGDRGDDVLTENAPSGDDFLAVVSRDWEAEALKAADRGVRVAVMRFGVVLGRDGGAMERMLPAFRLFVGGPLGKGAQWMPWIHMSDLLRAMFFLMEGPGREGVFNLCAPHPVTSREMAAALGRVLSRPSCMPAPAFMLRALMGEVASMMMASQRVIPRRLLDEDFEFRFPQIEEALQDLVG
jgi:uncharacterized protein (TIGR01777 family)